MDPYDDFDFDYEISLLDKSNEKKLKRRPQNAAPKRVSSGPLNLWEKNFGKINELQERQLLPDGNLVINCEITIFREEKTESGSTYPIPTPRS